MQMKAEGEAYLRSGSAVWAKVLRRANGRVARAAPAVGAVAALCRLFGATGAENTRWALDRRVRVDLAKVSRRAPDGRAHATRAIETARTSAGVHGLGACNALRLLAAHVFTVREVVGNGQASYNYHQCGAKLGGSDAAAWDRRIAHA
jgi:hypothetical protein